MDLDVVFKSLDCPYIVRYLGCFITETDVWICMELMATCFDRLLKKLQTAIPEDILGKVALAVSSRNRVRPIGMPNKIPLTTLLLL